MFIGKVIYFFFCQRVTLIDQVQSFVTYFCRYFSLPSLLIVFHEFHDCIIVTFFLFVFSVSLLQISSLLIHAFPHIRYIIFKSSSLKTFHSKRIFSHFRSVNFLAFSNIIEHFYLEMRPSSVPRKDFSTANKTFFTKGLIPPPQANLLTYLTSTHLFHHTFFSFIGNSCLQR